MAGLRGYGAGLDGTEGDETEEGAFRPVPAAHNALEGAFRAIDRDIWRERRKKKTQDFKNANTFFRGTQNICERMQSIANFDTFFLSPHVLFHQYVSKVSSYHVENKYI